MSPVTPAGKPRVPCVGAVVVDDCGRLLLVLRGREPARGMWSLPGGRVEPGESDAEAVVREVWEETGLDVAVGPRVGTVERPAPDGRLYVIHDYTCSVRGGALRAGDDAAAARWVPVAAVASMPTSPGLVETLRAWQVLP